LLELVQHGLEILGGDRDRFGEIVEHGLALVLIGAHRRSGRQPADQRECSYCCRQRLHGCCPSLPPGWRFVLTARAKNPAHSQFLSTSVCSWRIERSRPASVLVRSSPSSRHSSTTMRNDLISPSPSP